VKGRKEAAVKFLVVVLVAALAVLAGGCMTPTVREAVGTTMNAATDTAELVRKEFALLSAQVKAESAETIVRITRERDDALLKAKESVAKQEAAEAAAKTETAGRIAAFKDGVTTAREGLANKQPIEVIDGVTKVIAAILGIGVVGVGGASLKQRGELVRIEREKQNERVIGKKTS